MLFAVSHLAKIPASLGAALLDRELMCILSCYYDVVVILCILILLSD